MSFDDYKMSDPTQGLEFNDVIVGDGDPAKDGDLLKVKYTGIIMASGREFDNGKISVSDTINREAYTTIRYHLCVMCVFVI